MNVSRPLVYRLEQVTFAYGNEPVLSSLDLELRPGEILGILGPNGAGKTTLLRILGGQIRRWSGSVEFLGRNLKYWRPKELARHIAYLPQKTNLAFPYTAYEVVLMGRIPYQEASYFESPRDHEAARRALRLTESESLAHRLFQELSGGEQQLVCLSSALAQEPEVLLLDEPTVFLDLRHQLQICRILRRLHDEMGLTMVLVTHDLELAESFSSRLLFLKQGRALADLAATDSPLITPPELIERVFDVRAEISTRYASGQGARRIEVRFGE